jgi:hypothetical protein
MLNVNFKAISIAPRTRGGNWPTQSWLRRNTNCRKSGDSLMKMKRILVPVVCAALLATTGCGGGNGNGASSTPTPTPVPSGTVSGIAAKGLLLNAIVSFYSVTNGVASTTAITSVRTDAKTGAFSTSVASAGPVVVTVTTDSTTQMLDEISGTAIMAPTGLILHTVFDSVTNLQPISVTPLTEMAYDIAKSSAGALTTANIDAANNAVSTAFLAGAPVLYTQPIDIKTYASATAAKQEQAKFLAALAVAANEGIATGASGSPCATTYSANIVCLIGGLGNLLSVNSSGAITLASAANYVSSAYTSIDSGTVTVDGGQTPSALGLNVATAAETSFLAAIAKQAPLPGYDAGANPLSNTKALFANIRTNIIDQSETQTFGFAPTLTALQTDFQTNVHPIASNTISMLSAAAAAAKLITQGSVNYRQGCGYDPVGLNTASNVALCSYGISQGYILLTVTQNGPTSYSLQTQALEYPSSGTPPPYNQITNGRIVVPTIPALQSSFTWITSTTVPESGTFSGPYYVNATGGQVQGSLSATESSDWNVATDSGSITFGGSLSGGKGGVSLVSATVGSDSVLVIQNGSRLSTSPVTPIISAGSAPVTLTGTLDIPQFNTGAFEYAAKVTVGAPISDKSGAAAPPGTVSVAGSIDQLGSNGSTPLFDGTVSLSLQGFPDFDATQPISATNFFTVQAQLQGTLALTAGRLLTVSATANGSQITPTPTQPDSISATYSYTTPTGTATLNAAGQYDATNGFTGTITNNAGVVIAVTDPIGATVTGTVMANGTETATIKGAFIYYSDGTSESLF